MGRLIKDSARLPGAALRLTAVVGKFCLRVTHIERYRLWRPGQNDLATHVEHLLNCEGFKFCKQFLLARLVKDKGHQVLDLLVCQAQ